MSDERAALIKESIFADLFPNDTEEEVVTAMKKWCEATGDTSTGITMIHPDGRVKTFALVNEPKAQAKVMAEGEMIRKGME